MQISQESLNQIQANKSNQSDVERIVGYPMRKQETSKGEIWYYDYLQINHIGDNIDETTVIEFNSRGIVTKTYRTKGAGGNPLLK